MLLFPRIRHTGRLLRRLLRRRLAPASALLLLTATACGLRTLPPIRYVPLIGAEKKITTAVLLAQALKDRDASVRARAIELLSLLAQDGRKKVKKEVARILGSAARDRDPGIRLLAIEKLGAMEGEFSNKYLFAALKDPNPFIREKVLEVLARRQRQNASSESPQAAAP